MTLLEILDGELMALGHELSGAGDGLRGASGLAAEAVHGGWAMPGSSSPSVLAKAAVKVEHEERRIAELLHQAGKDAVGAERMFVATDEECERQFAHVMSGMFPSAGVGKEA